MLQHVIATLVASTASYRNTAVLNFAVQRMSIDKGGLSVHYQLTQLSHSCTIILMSMRPQLFLLLFQCGLFQVKYLSQNHYM